MTTWASRFVDLAARARAWAWLPDDGSRGAAFSGKLAELHLWARDLERARSLKHLALELQGAPGELVEAIAGQHWRTDGGAMTCP